jgi:hypothetical protein
MWSEGSFAYDEDDFSNYGETEMMDLRVDRDASVEFTLEEPLAAAPFLVDGLLTGIFFPLRQIISLFCEKSDNAYSKPQVVIAGQPGAAGGAGGRARGEGQSLMWLLSFPFGSKIACMPLLAFLFWGCALAMGIQLRYGLDPSDLRTLNTVEINVSIGDAVVAMTTYGAVVLLAACAIAHHPSVTSRWGVQDLWNEPFQQSVLPCDLPPQSRPQTTDFTGAPSQGSDNMAIGPSAAAGGGGVGGADSNQGLLDDNGIPQRKNSVHQGTSLRGAGEELTTLQGPKPRRYAPFMHVLLDEVPPLTTSSEADLDDDQDDAASVAQRHARSSLYFLYDIADWFEPQRLNREDIDESLKLFKKVWTDERHAEVERHLARRRKMLAREAAKKAAANGEGGDGSRPGTASRPRTSGGTGSRPGTAGGEDLGGTITAADVALLNPNAIEWRASDVFKFTIGDRIRRNDEHPELQVCFDGLNCITTDDTFIISNRMWANRCALYCVEGAADTHQWQAVESLFEVVEDLTLQLAAGLGNDRNPRKADRVVSIEMMLLGMSGREMLRRIDVFGNGNVSGSVGGSSVPAVSIVFGLLLAVILSVIPLAVRVLQGGGLHAKGSIGDLLCAYLPIFLSTLCITSLLAVMESIRRSLTNLEEALVSFTEMTLGAGPRQWAPVLNWYETVNIRSWFLLRQHILGAYHHHVNARVAGVALVMLGFCATWSSFGIGYGLTSKYSPPLMDGWAIQALTISLVIVIWCTRNLSHAIVINDVVLSHRRHLAKVQAALEEEIMLVMARVAATTTTNVTMGGGLASIAAISAAGGTMRSQRSGASRASSAASSHRQSAVTLATRNSDLQLLLDAKALLEDVRFAIQSMQPPISPFGFTISITHFHFCLAVTLVNVVALAMALAGVVQLSWRWKGI